MEGSGHTGGCVLNAQLLALAVLGGDGVHVVEDGLGQVVHIVVAGGSGDDQGGLNGDGGHIRILAIIGTGGNAVGGVEGAVSHQLVGDSAVDGHQICVIGGAQLGDGGSGSASHDESGVDLAVLQSVGAVREALVLGLDVILGQTGGGEHVHGVEVNAGAGGADGDALACQVSDRLDVGIHGDQLNRLGVQAAHHPEGVDGAGALEGACACPGVSHNIGLHGAQLVVT